MPMEHEWSAAPYKREVTTLDRINAHDWTSFTWGWRNHYLTQVIADPKPGANTAEFVNLEGIKVRVFGDAVIVTGRVIEKSQYQGRYMSGHYVWTAVLVKRNGCWQAVARQTSRVGEPKS
jgi:hypothetical protein